MVDPSTQMQCQLVQKKQRDVRTRLILPSSLTRPVNSEAPAASVNYCRRRFCPEHLQHTRTGDGSVRRSRHTTNHRHSAAAVAACSCLGNCRQTRRLRAALVRRTVSTIRRGPARTSGVVCRFSSASGTRDPSPFLSSRPTPGTSRQSSSRETLWTLARRRVAQSRLDGPCGVHRL